MRAKLLIKASLSAVPAMVAHRLPNARIERAIRTKFGESWVTVASDDSRLELMVINWFVAPEHRDLIRGYGYPYGSLLHYWLPET